MVLPIHLTGELGFLIGKWEWERTKFTDQDSPGFSVYYKNPETERFTYKIIFSQEGRIILIKNENLVETEMITGVRFYQTNPFDEGILEFELLTTGTGILKQLKFQKLYDYNILNALYSVPFSKEDGATYNWFHKSE